KYTANMIPIIDQALKGSRIAKQIFTMHATNISQNIARIDMVFPWLGLGGRFSLWPTLICQLFDSTLHKNKTKAPHRLHRYHVKNISGVKMVCQRHTLHKRNNIVSGV